MLSAVAGGGLTAASLGAPFASSALGAETPTPTPAPSEGAPTSPAASPGAPQAGSSQPATTTSTPASTTPPASTPSSTVTLPPPPAPEAPVVVLQRRQKATPASKPSASATPTSTGPASSTKPKSTKASGPSNVALSPQAVAGQAGALAAALASSQASVQSLSFYRIPLFLLPIYKAAAVQYGVPWQILAAINEIETNYGSDQSVSSAGAVGWMQFMPATWLQYGVDALNAGYADPYNPVDAIFAAARYLRAAGAANDLRAAILAYNHSQEYANSVLLRAKLISTYPKAVIATLTGLVDGRLPVSGGRLAWAAPAPAPASASASASSATANATALPGEGTGSAGATSASPAAPVPASVPGSSAPPTPTAAAAASAKAAAAPQPLQLVELTSAPNASVVAVQGGRIVGLGASRQLGRFLVLRDVYGDVFTYAGLGRIAPSYTLAKPRRASVKSPVVEIASTRDPAPSKPASAGSQPPLTLQVKTPLQKTPRSTPAAGRAQLSSQGADESPPAGMGKVRLFAHPGNPDALAAAASVASRTPHNSAGQRQPLRKGSVVATGTVLGRVSMPPGARDGHLRFAIQPAGDPSSVDPRPILANWAQLETALHPKGATAEDALLGATASDVFLLSKSQLERTVLSDPDITVYACGRHDIASGKVDKRVLAVLAFLSRSGLKPTVSALRCGQSQYTSAGTFSPQDRGDAVDISAINGVAITGHQGAGTITDLTIRTLLSLPGEFVPQQITSLMRYPGAPSTHAVPSYSNRIHLGFEPAGAAVALLPAAAAAVAHSARSGHTARSPLVGSVTVSPVQWSQLFTQIAALPAPKVARKPSSAAIPDRKHP
jgi:soluble lytic murein transglycosylase-like protein